MTTTTLSIETAIEPIGQETAADPASWQETVRDHAQASAAFEDAVSRFRAALGADQAAAEPGSPVSVQAELAGMATLTGAARVDASSSPALPGEVSAAPQTPAVPGEVSAAPQTPVVPGEVPAAPQTPVVPGEVSAAPQTPAVPGEVPAAPQTPAVPGEVPEAAGRQVATPPARPLPAQSDRPELAGEPPAAEKPLSAAQPGRNRARPDDVPQMRPDLPATATLAIPAQVEMPVAPAVVERPAAVVTVDAASARTQILVDAVEAVCDAILVSPGLVRGEGTMIIQLKADVLSGTEIQLQARGQSLSVAFIPTTAEVAVLIERNLAQFEQHLAGRIHNFQIAAKIRERARA